jgi:hypothetical protein
VECVSCFVYSCCGALAPCHGLGHLNNLRCVHGCSHGGHLTAFICVWCTLSTVARITVLMDQDNKRPRLAEPEPAVLSSSDAAVVVMLTDVEDHPNGAFHLWGVTAHQQTVLVRVHDYQPYFFWPMPVTTSSQPTDTLSDQQLAQLKHLLNCR